MSFVLLGNRGFASSILKLCGFSDATLCYSYQIPISFRISATGIFILSLMVLIMLALLITEFFQSTR